MHEIKSIHKQIGRIHQLQTDRDQQRPSAPKKTETRTCFRCAKYGHVAKFCRSKPQQTQPNRFNQPRQQFNQQRPQFAQRQNQWRQPFQTRQNSNNFNRNRPFQANDNRQRRDNGNYNQQRNNNRNYDQQRYNRQSNNRFNPNQRNQNMSNPTQPRNSTFAKSQDQRINTSRDSTNQHYSQPAQHAENDFQPNLTASQRWNTEIKRPAFPYDKAMAERAFAMHFDITPDSSPSSLNKKNFFEKNQTQQSSPT